MAAPSLDDVDSFIAANSHLVDPTSIKSKGEEVDPDAFIQEHVGELAKDPDYNPIEVASEADKTGDPETKELAFKVFKHQYDKPEPFSMAKAKKATVGAFEGIWGAVKGAGKMARNVKDLGMEYAQDAYNGVKFLAAGNSTDSADALEKLSRNDEAEKAQASELISSTANAAKGLVVDLPYGIGKNARDVYNWATGQKLSEDGIRERFEEMTQQNSWTKHIADTGGIPGVTAGPEERAAEAMPLTGNESEEDKAKILAGRGDIQKEITQDVADQTGAAGFGLLPSSLLSNPVTHAVGGAALRVAGGAVTKAGRLAQHTGHAGTLYGIFSHSPETVIGSLATKAALPPAGRLLTEAGDAMFTGERIAGGAGRQLAAKTLQSAATGGVLGTGFAMGADSPEQAVGDVLGGIATAPVFMLDNINVGKTRGQVMSNRAEVEASRAKREERFGALRQFGAELPRSVEGHDEGMAQLHPVEQDRINLMQGILAGRMNAKGEQLEVNVLPENRYGQLQGTRNSEGNLTRGFVGADGNIYLNAGAANQTGGVDRTSRHEFGHVADRLSEIVGGNFRSGLTEAITNRLYDANGDPAPAFRDFIREYTEAHGRRISEAAAEREFIAETTSKILESKGIEDFSKAPGLGEIIRQGASDAMKGLGLAPAAKDGLFSWTEIPAITRQMRGLLREVGKGSLERARKGLDDLRATRQPESNKSGTAEAQASPAPALMKLADKLAAARIDQSEVDTLRARAADDAEAQLLRNRGRRKVNPETDAEQRAEVRQHAQDEFDGQVSDLLKNLDGGQVEHNLNDALLLHSMNDQGGGYKGWVDKNKPTEPPQPAVKPAPAPERPDLIVEEALAGDPAPGTFGISDRQRSILTKLGWEPKAIDAMPQHQIEELTNNAVEEPALADIELQDQAPTVTAAATPALSSLQINGEKTPSSSTSTATAVQEPPAPRVSDVPAAATNTGIPNGDQVAEARAKNPVGTPARGVIDTLDANRHKVVWVKDYNSAKKEGEGFGEAERTDEIRRQSAGKRKAGATGTIQTKPFIPVEIKVNAKGEPYVNGFDVDVLFSNLRHITDFMREKGIENPLKTDKDIEDALTAYNWNHNNGFDGAGARRLNKPGPEYRLPSANQDAAPMPLHEDPKTARRIADILNMAVHSKMSDIGGTEAGKAMALNLENYGFRQGTEVNPLRADLEAAGFDTNSNLAKRSAFYGRLSTDLVKGGVTTNPEAGESVRPHGFDIDLNKVFASGKPQFEAVAAGFMPSESTSIKSKGALEDVDFMPGIALKEGDEANAKNPEDIHPGSYWLDPNGKFHELGMYDDHQDWAAKRVGLLPGESMPTERDFYSNKQVKMKPGRVAEDHLKEKGWVRVSRSREGEDTLFLNGRINSKQESALKVLHAANRDWEFVGTGVGDKFQRSFGDDFMPSEKTDLKRLEELMDKEDEEDFSPQDQADLDRILKEHGSYPELLAKVGAQKAAPSKPSTEEEWKEFDKIVNPPKETSSEPQKDPLTGRSTRITSGRITPEVSRAISDSLAEDHRRYNEAARKASESGSDEAFEQLAEILPKASLSDIGLKFDQGEILGDIENPKSRHITRAGHGGESITYTSGDVAYKIFYPQADGGIGIQGNVKRRENPAGMKPSENPGPWDLHYEAGTVSGLLEKLHVLSRVGGIPSEVIGVTEGGSLIVKQPKYPGKKLSSPYKQNFDGFYKRSQIEPVAPELKDDKQIVKWFEKVAVVDGQPYAIGDLGGSNHTIDNSGNFRVSDAVVGKIPVEMLEEIPALKEQIDRLTAEEDLTRPDIAFMPGQHHGKRLEHSIPEESLKVTHYTTAKIIGNKIDPKRMNPKAGLQNNYMYRGENKSFFFVGDSKPKKGENVTGDRSSQYDAEISGARIYDMDADPLNKWGSINPAKADAELKELGYLGFKASTDDGREFVALYKPTKVTQRSSEDFMPAESKEDFGDGRGTSKFFSKVTKGSDAHRPKKDYKPVIRLDGDAAEFAKERAKHRGDFDQHITTSIPGFDEVQSVVGNALSKGLPEGSHVLDIGASEGALVKAIAATSEGRVKATGLDPNADMKAAFDRTKVDGADYEQSAFGPKETEGKKAWEEDDGTIINHFDPKGRKFDAVHEAMTFQFLSKDRGAHLDRVKELLSPEGIAVFEEKFNARDQSEYDANESKKDDFKGQYYSQDELAQKKSEVLQAGGKGMGDKQVPSHQMEAMLSDRFKHVIQFWDSGNFKGYAASDSAEAMSNFAAHLPKTDSEFSTTQTPRVVHTTGSLPKSPELTELAHQYAKSAGVELTPSRKFKMNPETAAKLADHHDQQDLDYKNPEVKKSFGKFITETVAQAKAILEAGYKVEPYTGDGEPYRNAREMAADIRENKHLFFRTTENAIGGGTKSDRDPKNPMLQETEIKTGDHVNLANDVFRWVHDFFGHAKDGNTFTADGEYNAFREHAQMYSKEAQPAVELETLAYNAWFNHGKHLRAADGSIPKRGEPGYIPAPARPYAPRKLYVPPRDLIEQSGHDASFMPGGEVLTKGLGPGKRRDYSWLTPGGVFHAVGNTHAEDARRLFKIESNDPVMEAWKRGNVRVTFSGADLYAHREGGGLSPQQKKALTRLAEDSGKSRLIFDRGEDYKVIWSNDEAFMPSKYEVSPEEKGGDFYKALSKAAEGREEGKFVTVHPEEFYKDPEKKLFLAEDGSAGVGVDKDGYMFSAFSDPDAKSPQILKVFGEAAKHGRILDAFDDKGKLPNFYALYGFRPVARVPFNREYAPEGWNYDKHGEPDVVIMAKDPNAKGGINYNKIRDSVPVMEYDDAIAAAEKLAPKEGASIKSKSGGALEDFMPYAGWKAKGYEEASKEGRTFMGKYDGKDRFEIDDSQMLVLNPGTARERIEAGSTLGKLIHHSELFKNYPFLKKVGVVASEDVDGMAHWDGENNQIAFNSEHLKNAKDLDDIKTLLLHETQHAIQDHEDFARGSSAPYAFHEYRNQYQEKETPVLMAEREARMAKDWIKGQGSKERIAEYEDKAKKLRKEFDKWAEDMEGDEGVSASQLYVRTAGEIEARDVANRRNLTPEQRKEIPPYSSENIPKNKALVLDIKNPVLGDFMPASKSKDAGALQELNLGARFTPDALRQQAVKRRTGNVADKFPEAIAPVYKKENGKFVLDDDGKPSAEKIDYNLHETPLAKEAAKGIRGEEKRNEAISKAYADKLVSEFDRIKDRPDIMAGKSWYELARTKIKEHFGDKALLFAQLLGATSARTPVAENFAQALEAFNLHREGKYKGYAEKYLKLESQLEAGIPMQFTQTYSKQVGNKKTVIEAGTPVTPTNFKFFLDQQGVLPKKGNDKEYNANSLQVLRVLAGNWEAKVGGPKTPNFSRNLSGEGENPFAATIDVWAARNLHRLGHEGLTDKRWRITPESEPGVADPDFFLGQSAYADAAKRLGMNPDSLQAVLWFAEKDVWESRGWTRGAGAELSDFNTLLDKTKEEGGRKIIEKPKDPQGALFDFMPAKKVDASDGSSDSGRTMSNNTDSFKKLSSVLQTRRNLESSLTPADQIGTKNTRSGYESESDYQERIKASRARHQDWSRGLWLSSGLKSKDDVLKKIAELKKEEEELWAEARPDLYAK